MEVGKFTTLSVILASSIACIWACGPTFAPPPEANYTEKYTTYEIVPEEQRPHGISEILKNVYEGVSDFGSNMLSQLGLPSFECPLGYGFFRDQFDCATYYDCKRGQFREHKCPPGQGFSEFFRECVPRENAGCKLGPLDEYHSCDRSGLEAVATNCSQFYVCVGQRAFIESCPPGKKFDKNSHLCTSGISVSCANTTST